MSGSGHFLSCFCSLGFLLCSSGAWHVKMPNTIRGLVDSCLVIPCSFDYHEYPPTNPNRVVWYQYVSRGYPLVYDSWYPNKVIDAFRTRTFKTQTSPYANECSLKIDPVQWSHHGQKIYPWVDPEHVGKSTYRFFDTTVTILVVDRAQKPNIEISGSMRVGESVSVECMVEHTCYSNPPSLSLNIPLQYRRLEHRLMTDGTTMTILTTTLKIERDIQMVECQVRHPGGQTAKASTTLNAECSFWPLTIQPTQNEFLEGKATGVTCTASYTCPKHVPTLTWSYDDMPTSTDSSKSGRAQWNTVSTLTFTASANDNGRSLTCFARFTGGQRQQASITLRVKRNIRFRDWAFTTPGSITGMRGSCIIIPCTFSYSKSQPDDLRVIWYLFQNNGYPPVFDTMRSVVTKFDGITSLIGLVRDGNCSLKIERLEMSHNRDRLYPWMDKNPITTYHIEGNPFYTKTTQLIVSDHAERPQLDMTEIPRVGEESKVTCHVHHTCMTAPPTLTITGIGGTARTVDAVASDGTWERKVERSWTVTEEDRSVKCTVRYPGGQEATNELQLNVECPYDEIKMTEPPGEATEGVAKSVICSVSYKCKKNTPTIVWNYGSMPGSPRTTKISSDTYSTVSNLTFIGSLEDNGKPLTCTARFVTGETSDSAIVQVKGYVRSVEERDPRGDAGYSILAGDLPFRFSALTRSCVVIPCSLQPPDGVQLTRGIWTKRTGDVIYHNAQRNVIDHFKDRTRMLGNLDEGNCSLEIDDIKAFDNGPFCFHAKSGDDRYRLNDSCVFIVMKASPETPAMSDVPAEVEAGSTVAASCSVRHTCPSHPPVFSWSVSDLDGTVTHAVMSQGVWETNSTITFIVAAGDGVRSLTCTATFWRGKTRSSTVKMTVRGSLMYRFRSSLPVSIPASAIVLLIIVLAAAFGVIVARKRKNADASERPPPRPEKRRSLWDRMSRRFPGGDDRPPRPQKRRSMWSRFSRNRDNRADLTVGFL